MPLTNFKVWVHLTVWATFATSPLCRLLRSLVKLLNSAALPGIPVVQPPSIVDTDPLVSLLTLYSAPEAGGAVAVPVLLMSTFVEMSSWKHELFF